MIIRIRYVVAMALLLVACAGPVSALPEQDERGRLSTLMVNLSSAVDGYFADLQQAPTDPDDVIMKKATEHDPRLLAPEFDQYTLRVQYQNRSAVLLLCTKDGKFAIMEDAGCSARLDRQVTEAADCNFALRVREGCIVEIHDVADSLHAR